MSIAAAPCTCGFGFSGCRKHGEVGADLERRLGWAQEANVKLKAEVERLREALMRIAKMPTSYALSDMARDVVGRTAAPVAIRALRADVPARDQTNTLEARSEP